MKSRKSYSTRSIIVSCKSVETGDLNLRKKKPVKNKYACKVTYSTQPNTDFEVSFETNNLQDLSAANKLINDMIAAKGKIGFK